MTKIVYYDIVKREYKPHPLALVNASVWMCALCDTVIDGMGGQPNTLCEKCGDDIAHNRMKYKREREENE